MPIVIPKKWPTMNRSLFYPMIVSSRKEILFIEILYIHSHSLNMQIWISMKLRSSTLRRFGYEQRTDTIFPCTKIANENYENVSFLGLKYSRRLKENFRWFEAQNERTYYVKNVNLIPEKRSIIWKFHYYLKHIMSKAYLAYWIFYLIDATNNRLLKHFYYVSTILLAFVCNFYVYF